MHRSRFSRFGQFKPSEALAWGVTALFLSYLLAIAALGALTGR